MGRTEELNEDLLQFVWQHKLLAPQPLRTVSGLALEVLRPGDVNRDAGPDFFNARIRLNGVTLAGNIEIHVKSSDWLKHGHQSDRSYDNIILHVVYEHDSAILQNAEHNVEVLVLKELVPEQVLNRYRDLTTSRESIACSKQLSLVEDAKFSLWLGRMFVERLEAKSEQVKSIWQSFRGDYVQTFFTLLIRNFGFKVNALPFELLSRQLPVTLLMKHSDKLLQLEALMLGGAGMLQEPFKDAYPRCLQNEAEHLLAKYRIVPLRKELFKFSRMRPANFPGLRLAQLAGLIHHCPALFSAPQRYNSFHKIKEAMCFEMQGYWRNHYQLDGDENPEDLRFGEASAHNVMINTFAPFFFFYLKQTGRSDYHEVPLSILQECWFEDNAKTRLFRVKKQCFRSAADSQALIHLHDCYCSQRRCLNCGVAAAILK